MAEIILGVFVIGLLVLAGILTEEALDGILARYSIDEIQEQEKKRKRKQARAH